MVRLIRSDDAEAYFALVSANRHQMEDFFADTLIHTATLADTLVFVADYIRQAEYGIQYLFVIEQADKGIIGSLEVRHIHQETASGEIGFFVHQFEQHSIIMIRSLNFVAEFCFSFLGLKRLLFRTPLSIATP